MNINWSAGPTDRDELHRWATSDTIVLAVIVIAEIIAIGWLW